MFRDCMRANVVSRNWSCILVAFLRSFKRVHKGLFNGFEGFHKGFKFRAYKGFSEGFRDVLTELMKLAGVPRWYQRIF